MKRNPITQNIRAVVLAAIGCSSAFAFGSARAATQGFIEAAGRTDIAYDTVHDVLYISGGDSLRRFDMKTGVFLDPFVLGGKTMGMDISPDGKTLAVANSTQSVGGAFVDLIRLDTGVSSRVNLGSSFMEGGTFTVAYDQQGKLLTTSTFQGSGWVPLRSYDESTQKVSVLGSVRQNSMLSASADGSVVAVAESNISDGAWGVYHSGDTKYVSQHQGYNPVSGGTSWFNFEIGVSRDGNQFAIPTYGGTFIGDATSVQPLLGEYAGQSPIGVGYSPTTDRVFMPFAGTNELREYDALTLQEVGSFSTPGRFDWVGNHAFQEGRTKVADDGSFVFSTLDNGVFYAQLSDGIAAPVPEPTSMALMLLGLGVVGGAAARRSKGGSQSQA